MRCVSPRMKAALWGHNETQTATSSVSRAYCPGLRLNVQECGVYARNNCLVCVSLCIKNRAAKHSLRSFNFQKIIFILNDQ